MDDLKALRDEIARKLECVISHRRNRPGLEDLDSWAARLTSIIERNEKERAFIEAYRVYENRPNYDNECLLEDSWRALTERAKK